MLHRKKFEIIISGMLIQNNTTMKQCFSHSKKNSSQEYIPQLKSQIGYPTLTQMQDIIVCNNNASPKTSHIQNFSKYKGWQHTNSLRWRYSYFKHIYVDISITIPSRIQSSYQWSRLKYKPKHHRSISPRVPRTHFYHTLLQKRPLVSKKNCHCKLIDESQKGLCNQKLNVAKGSVPKSKGDVVTLKVHQK